MNKELFIYYQDEKGNIYELKTDLEQELCQQLAKLNSKINELIEYGKTCLKELEKKEQYIDESVDVISLLKQLHHNYIDKLIKLKEKK